MTTERRSHRGYLQPHSDPFFVLGGTWNFRHSHGNRRFAWEYGHGGKRNLPNCSPLETMSMPTKATSPLNTKPTHFIGLPHPHQPSLQSRREPCRYHLPPHPSRRRRRSADQAHYLHLRRHLQVGGTAPSTKPHTGHLYLFLWDDACECWWFREAIQNRAWTERRDGACSARGWHQSLRIDLEPGREQELVYSVFAYEGRD